jgi:hypothetical protein
VPKRVQFDFRRFDDEAYERLRHMAYLRGDTVASMVREMLMNAARDHALEGALGDPGSTGKPLGVKPPWERP